MKEERLKQVEDQLQNGLEQFNGLLTDLEDTIKATPQAARIRKKGRKGPAKNLPRGQEII